MTPVSCRSAESTRSTMLGLSERGNAYDETRTTLAARTPRLPDQRSQAGTLIGASWHATPSLEVNFAYTKIDLDTPSIELVDTARAITWPAGTTRTQIYSASRQKAGVLA